MRRTSNAIVFVVLFLGNAALAYPLTPPQPVRKQQNLSLEHSAEHHIEGLLQARGLEAESARAKAGELFTGPRPARSQLDALCERLDGLDLPRLESALVKRALFNKPVNFADAGALARLYHEATGIPANENVHNALRDMLREPPVA
jgi:hypothetical protein